MTGYEWEERAAICEYDGCLSREDAEVVAENCVGQMTRSEAPDAWDRANRRWRRAVAKKYGQGRMKDAHEALKKKHGAKSFADLTVSQIETSIKRIAR